MGNKKDKKRISALDELIPELNERIEINDDFSVSLDTENSTETTEQQLARTRHEENPPPLNIVSEPAEELSPDALEVTDVINHINFILVESTEDSDPDTDQQSNSTDEIELAQQQLDLEQAAQLERTTVQPIPSSDTDTVTETAGEENTDRNDKPINDKQARELLLDKAWIKVEMLLMDNLPTQMSGAFLQLLDSRINANKQQLMDELSLLDEDSFQRLLDTIEMDQNFGTLHKQ